MEKIQVFGEIVDKIEDAINHHLSRDNQWYPHEYIPWSEGKNFTYLDGKDWEPSDAKLDDHIRESLIIGLISEDNLPNYYFGTMTSYASKINPKFQPLAQEWLKLWAAEEGRHSIALRDYLLVTRNADPMQIEDERVRIIRSGWPSFNFRECPYVDIVYPSIQELATRIVHRNTGLLSNDPVLDKMMNRLAKDENNHMIFYRSLVDAVLEVDQNGAIDAIVDTIINFQMPGHSGIENFYSRAMKIALGGIYDLKQHKEGVLLPLIEYWKLYERDNLDENAEKALKDLTEYLKNLDKFINDFEERKEEYIISLQNK